MPRVADLRITMTPHGLEIRGEGVEVTLPGERVSIITPAGEVEVTRQGVGRTRPALADPGVSEFPTGTLDLLYPDGQGEIQVFSKEATTAPADLLAFVMAQHLSNLPLSIKDLCRLLKHHRLRQLHWSTAQLTLQNDHRFVQHLHPDMGRLVYTFAQDLWPVLNRLQVARLRNISAAPLRQRRSQLNGMNR